MTRIRLRNKTNKIARAGALVKINSEDKKTFQYVTDLTNLDVIGTINESTMPGGMCTINLINEVGTQQSMIICETTPLSIDFTKDEYNKITNINSNFEGILKQTDFTYDEGEVSQIDVRYSTIHKRITFVKNDEGEITQINIEKI